MKQQTIFKVLYQRETSKLRVIFSEDLTTDVMEMLQYYFARQMNNAEQFVSDIRDEAKNVFKSCNVVTIEVAIQNTVEFMKAWQTYFATGYKGNQDAQTYFLNLRKNRTPDAR